MSVVVKAKIKELAAYQGKPLNVAGDFAPKLALKVESMIKEACDRAKANGRNTVMAKDI
jgi:histone H3/H4